MSTAAEWLRDYYGILILVVIILLIFFWGSLMRFLRKPKKNKAADFRPIPEMESTLFGVGEQGLFEEIQSKDTITNFSEQRESAERQIKQIKEEGKKLVSEEHASIQEYHHKKLRFERERKHLGMKYSILINQLRMLDEMIINQARISEEFKKIKESENS